MFKVVRQATVGIKEVFGRYEKTLEPGIHFYIPFVSRIYALPTNTTTVPYKFQVKTKDNVFANVHVTVSYRVNDPYKAFYKLKDPKRQINDALEDSVRGSVADMDLDHLFLDRTTIQKHVDGLLSDKMCDYGYEVESVFVTEIDPDHRVKDAMNDINASKREKEAAEYKGEAQRILAVKEAEANKERQRLNGEGIAAMRKAIVDGYREGIEDMASKLGIDPKDAISLVLSAQYMDTLEKLSHSTNTKTVFLPSNPSSSSQFRDEFRNILLATKE